MPTVQAEESTTLIEDGTYKVECIAIVNHELENPSFGVGDVFKWSFRVVDEVDTDGEPIVLDPVSNRKLTPLTKFWAWAVALGGQPEVGKPFNTDVLIGAHAMAQVEAKVKPDGTKGFPKIVGLVAMPKSRQRNGSAPSPAPVAASPVVEATDPVERISKWWKKVLAEGLDRKAVMDQAVFTYEREPINLTDEELESVRQMLITA